MEALLLEKEPLAIGAYSTRILRRNYQRALMRVRRLADSAQADVRADSNGILSLNSRIKVASGTSSATTLGEFLGNSAYTDVDSIGATGATVSIWYDQSASNNHLTQTVTNYQPRIAANTGTIYQNDSGPQVLFWPTSPDLKYMDMIEMNGSFTVHLGLSTLGVGTSIKMYDGTSDIFDISRSSNTISLSQVSSSVVSVNGHNKGSETSIAYDSSKYTVATISGVFSSTGNARIGGNSGGLSDLYIYKSKKDGKRTKEVEISTSRQTSSPLAYSNRQDINTSSFLNQYQGAAAAYSLRDLNGSPYTKIIRVRRDVDNKEAVVYPDSSGYVSLDSQVYWAGPKTIGVTAPSSPISSATTLGQFLGDSTYSDPDALGTPSNGYVVEMFDQVSQNQVYGRRLLDYHSGSEAAYSFRRLSTSYTGACMEMSLVLSGSIIETQDILFDDSGNALSSIINYIRQKQTQYGPTVAFLCSKWYDQSGNNRHLVQTAIANMPRVSLQEQNGELSFGASNGISHMQVTGLNIPAPYSYSFSFYRGLNFDGEIVSFDNDVFVGASSGSYRISSEGNVINSGISNVQVMSHLYGVHDSANSEVGVNGTYVSGTGASKAISYIKLFPTSGFVGNLHDFILWGSNKSTNPLEREDIELYSKDLFRTEDPNAKAIVNTAQPKIYDSSNGLVNIGGKPAIDVAAGNYFVFKKDKVAGNSTLSSFTCFSTSDSRGSLYGVQGGYQGPYLNSTVTTANSFLNNLGSPSNFLDGDAVTISSAADGFTAIGDGTKKIHSLINGDSSSWAPLAITDVTLFNFNSGASSSDTLVGKYHEIVFFSADVSNEREQIESNINSAFSSYSLADVNRTAKLLNNFPSAAAAYSVRQLNANYKGPLIRIDNGSTELDIYPKANGDLDTDAILGHAAAGSGYAGVSVWYDQSGNGNNAVQATNANQPRIANSNAIIYENGKPALESNGSYFLTLLSDISSVVSDYTIFDITRRDRSQEASISGRADGFQSFGGGDLLIFDTENGWFYNDASYLQPALTSQNQTLKSFSLVAPTAKLYENTIEVRSGIYSQKVMQGSIRLFFGNMIGTRSEIIFYPSDQSSSRKEIESNINKYFDIHPESPKPLLLDKIKEDAAAAYSLRKLRSTYSGPAVRVRRASDDVEADVYFDKNGELSLDSRVANATETTIGKAQGSATFTLAAPVFGEFVGNSGYVNTGATSAFVVCWYDQGPKGYDAVQNTAANQPKIYDGQTGLVLDNGKPAVQFDGSDDNFATAAAVVTGAEFFCSNVLTMGTTGQPWGDQGTLGVRAYQASATNLRVQYNTDNGSFQMTGDISGSGQRLKSTRLISGTQEVFDNGSLATSATSTFTSLASNDVLRFGMRYNTSTFFDGKLQEFVLYTSDQSRSRFKIESDINNHYSIYQGSFEARLLNTYPQAAAAYSLRVLDSLYMGPLVRVRRDSDNIEVDVYPDANGVLSERSLVKNKIETTTGVTVGTPSDSRAFTFGEFAYGTNCYVVEWKDQSGNANNATQTTAANQPKIYDSVTGVVTDNGKPAVEFLDSADILASSSATEFNSVLQNELYCVASYGTINVGNQYAAGVQIGGSSRGVMIGTNSSGDDIRYHCDASTFKIAVGGTIAVDTQMLHGGTYDGTTRHARLNGASVGTNTDAGTTGTADVYFIGKHPNLAAGVDKKVQELILYPAYNGNEANIESNINDFYNIY